MSSDKSKDKSKRKKGSDDSDEEVTGEGEEESEAEEYVVEKIIDKRMRAGRVEYFLKWKGYSEEDNTWEPKGNLECADLIAEFEVMYANKNRKENPSLSKSADGRKEKETASSATSAISSRKKKARKEAEPAGPKGFERGLEPEKIIGATDANGQLSFLMKWQGSEEADLVKAVDANKKCPQVVIRFYEERLTWQTTASTSEK